jgi:hypothetical protein
MKKIVLLFIVAFAFSFAAQSQYTKADVFKVSEITFYGLDFSNVRLVGSEGFTDPYAIKNQFFKSWNNLFIAEPDKYNLAEVFGKSNVTINLDIVTERNEMPDPGELVIDEPYSFGEEVVSDIIAEYDTGEEGIGLVFIIESFNKIDEMGYMWVTFFDMSTGEVLFAKHMAGDAGGFGLRNYWAKSYYNVMKDIGKKQWKIWMNE